ncbi:MAG: YtxH domain-containing protein [Acidobacteriaceae bacterium]
MEAQETTTGMGWFIAGLGLGALLGVLFAPKSGRETREGLVTGARDGKEYVNTRSKQAREQINAVVDRGRDQVKDYAERGKDVAEKGRERWSNIVDRVAAGQGNGERGSSLSDEEEARRRGAAESHF